MTPEQVFSTANTTALVAWLTSSCSSGVAGQPMSSSSSRLRFAAARPRSRMAVGGTRWVLFGQPASQPFSDPWLLSLWLHYWRHLLVGRWAKDAAARGSRGYRPACF